MNFNIPEVTLDSLYNDKIVGTSKGLNVSIYSFVNGTQTFPVFGCTQKGLFNKWLIVLDTLISRRG